MTARDGLFLAVLADAVRGRAYGGPLDAADAEPLFRAAEIHSVLPLVAEAVYRRQEFKGGDAMKDAQSRSVQRVIRQITQENEFLSLLEDLQQRGYDPLVIKGMVCRTLYPKPYLRPSVDEDLLVPASDFSAYVRLLAELSMFADQPDADPEEAFELSFHKENSPLYVEVHKSLFAPDSDAYSDCNRPFDGALAGAASITIQDLRVRTLAPTDHLLYLILHAFKHFLHSGFGIRYVCDIALFAEHYRDELDMEHVVTECEKLRAGQFAAAICRIGTKYLGMDPAAVPEVWREMAVDETPLLEDILTGGLYGVADENRLHSGNITLNARASGHGGSVWKAIFPSAEYLRWRFPYAQKSVLLLPIAWAHRILLYLKRSTKGTNVSAAASVRIGQERVRMMKYYGIIEG